MENSNLINMKYCEDNIDSFFEYFKKENLELMKALGENNKFSKLINFITNELDIKMPDFINSNNNNNNILYSIINKDGIQKSKIVKIFDDIGIDKNNHENEEGNLLTNNYNQYKIEKISFEYINISIVDNEYQKLKCQNKILENVINDLQKTIKEINNKFENKERELNKMKIILDKKENDFNNQISKEKKKNEEEIQILKNDYENIFNGNKKLIEELKKDLRDNSDDLNKMKEDNTSKKMEISELKLEINKNKYKINFQKESLEKEKLTNIVFRNLIKEKDLVIEKFKKKFKSIEEIISDKIKINENNNKLNISKKEEEKTNYDDEDKFCSYGKIGLINRDLNCYMSSVIQILKNLKVFALDFMNSKTEDKVIESLQKLINNLYYSKEKIISLKEFKSDFSYVYKRFEGIKANDSTYFLIYLIQYLHKAYNNLPNENITKINKFKSLCLKDDEYKELEKFINKYESKNNSFIQNLFYGYQMNKIFCAGCNNSQISFQSFSILDLPVMDEKNELEKLAQCLNCYLITKDQKGNSDFNCSKCKRKLLSNLTTIVKLPSILIINLKRVGERTVYYHDIEIPFILKSKSIDKLNKFNQDYELIGFIKHFGNENNGHNIAYSKNIFDNKWYEYNDSSVKEVYDNPSTNKAFLLFYQIIE